MDFPIRINWMNPLSFQNMVSEHVELHQTIRCMGINVCFKLSVILQCMHYVNRLFDLVEVGLNTTNLGDIFFFLNGKSSQ